MLKTLIILSTSLILFSCTHIKGNIEWLATGKAMEGIEIQISHPEVHNNNQITKLLMSIKTDSEGYFSTTVWFYSLSDIRIQVIEPDSIVFEPSIWMANEKKGEVNIGGYPSGNIELRLRSSEKKPTDITWEIMGQENVRSGLLAFNSDSNINLKVKAETMLGFKISFDGRSETDSLMCEKGEKIIYTLAY